MIPTDDLIPKSRRGRNQHSLAFQIPSASKDVYKYSFFPQTTRDWNDLPESLISFSELSDDKVHETCYVRSWSLDHDACLLKTITMQGFKLAAITAEEKLEF